MNTVPSLCGTATISAAAAIGFVFGNKSSSRDPSLSQHDTTDLAESPGFTPHFTTSFHLSHFHEAMPQSSSNTTQSPRTPTSRDRSSLSAARHSLLPQKSMSDVPSRQSSREPVSSWKTPSSSKRLSSVTNSRISRPSSSDAQMSKSFTYSSDSTTSTIASRSVSSPMPPNKLVKRSISTHALNDAFAGPSSVTTHTLKRPATSHQRSATLSLYNGTPPIESRESQDDQFDVEYSNKTPRRSYKEEDYTNESPPLPRKPNSLDLGRIRRILPQGGVPILVKASSFVPISDGLPNRDHSNVRVSRMLSRSSTSMKPSRVFYSSPISTSPSTESSALTQRPKRSFSIGHLLPGKTASWIMQQKPDAVNPKLRRAPSRRIFSSPVIQMDSSKDDSAKSVLDGEDSPTSTRPPTSSRSLSQRPPFEVLLSARRRNSHARRSRLSETSSDINSSNPGSDSGTRIFSWIEGDDTDERSDTIYDSMRTGTTKSGISISRPGLETLFDRPTTSQGSEDDPVWMRPTRGNLDMQMPMSIEDSTTHAYKDAATPRALSDEHTPSNSEWGLTNNQTPPWWNHQPHWGMREDAASSNSSDSFDERLNEAVKDIQPASRKEDTRNTGKKPNTAEPMKINLFDWSEKDSLEQGYLDTTPPRPKTVHGKKLADNLGTSSTTSRTSSAMLARSQSYPALAEVVNDDSGMTQKFGTWGTGSRLPSEMNWECDFLFDEPTVTENQQGSPGPDGNVDKSVVFIPESIRQQQSSLLTNIHLVREWGKSILQLKELRARALSLNLLTDRSQSLFDDVNAMIDMADKEAEDGSIVSHSSPSSVRVSDGDFDEGRSPNSGTTLNGTPSTRQQNPSTENNLKVVSKSSPRSASPSTPKARPRKDSEAVALTVIEALHQGRLSSKVIPDDVQSSLRQSSQRKVPFDIAALKHIIPYVGTLTRNVKQLLRESEGLSEELEPKSDGYLKQPGLALKRAFIEPVDSSPTPLRRRRTTMRAVDDVEEETSDQILSSRFKLMGVTLKEFE